MRARKVTLIAAIVVLAGLGAAFVLRSHVEPLDFSENARSVFDEGLQNMSVQKPFKYEILNIKWISASPISRAGWCVTIDPPLRMKLEATEAISTLSHFFVDYPSPTWTGTTGIRFEDADKDRKQWTGMGCGEW